MRKKNVCEIPDEYSPMSDGNIIRNCFRFELITPMFGGDADSWQLDLKNPVRGQSVKGQLRFWWRTMQQETDHKKLLKKENQLWGGKIDEDTQENNRIKSRVTLSISEYDLKDENIVLAEMANNYAVQNDVIPTNVLFPITKNVKNGENIFFITKMSFTLNISYPKSEKNTVLNSLKLWTLFGGIGARTRRGTGSIHCKELLDDFINQTDIVNYISSVSADEKHPLAYPRMSGATLYAASCTGEPAPAWHAFLENYGRYRQDRRPGRRPGRSYWPEPDAIRRITGQHSADHQPDHPDGKWFPRAAFGLPILTRFNTPGDPGNPRDILLEPDIDGSGERYPSPVILKVIKLADGSLVRCALVLNQKFPTRLRLKVDRNVFPVDEEMLPFHNGYQNNKIMRKGDELHGDSIYENLAKHLKLQEVK